MPDQVKRIVLEACEGKDWDWKTHVESVVRHSKILAKRLDADEEICEISAWLHDIVKIRYGKREKHHVRGAEEAAKILQELGYPEERIEKVRHCILTHSSDKSYMPGSVEAKIVAASDALSHFDNLLALVYVVYHLRGAPIEEGRDWLIQKYKSCWDKLDQVPEAKEIARPKYEAIKLVLRKE